jgi:putative transposase
LGLCGIFKFTHRVCYKHKDRQYFTKLVVYIHQNPELHGLIDDFRLWPYSSYDGLLNEKNGFLRKDVIRDWFSDVDGYLTDHFKRVRAGELSNNTPE